MTVKQNGKKLKPKKPSFGRRVVNKFLKLWTLFCDFFRKGYCFKLITYFFKYVLFGITIWSILLTTVLSGIPSVASFLAQAISVSADADIVDTFVLWMLPNMFLDGFLFILDYKIAKILWNLFSKWCDKAVKSHIKFLKEMHESDE